MKKLGFVLWLLLPLGLFAQRNLEKANDAYDHFEYARAIDWYLKVLDEGANPEAEEKLAHCYRLTQQYKNAVQWYAKVVESPFGNPDNRLYYAQMLLCTQQRDAADRQAQQFLDSKPGDPRGLALRQAVRDMELFYKNEGRFELRPAPFNTPDAAEFAPAWYADGLVFSSDRKGAGDRNDAGSGRSFTGLYFARQGVAQALGALRAAGHRPDRVTTSPLRLSVWLPKAEVDAATRLLHALLCEGEDLSPTGTRADRQG